MAGKLTIEQARILWGMLTDEQQSAFKLIGGMAGKKGKAEVSVVNSLFDLKLIYRTKDFISGEEIVALTATGKKLKTVAADAAQEGEANGA